VGTIRVENRNRSGDALMALAVAVVLLLLVLWPLAMIASRPSPEEVARAERAANQQAQLDNSWRPWTTAAENLAVICGCLGVPTTIVLVTFVVVRRTRVMWPIEDTHLQVRTPPVRPATGDDSAVLVGVSTRPEPQDADAA
jgi:ABC-type Fe3+ transport system permease subunit